MKSINKTKNQIIFEADIGEPLANAIRRYLNRVLVMAIDEIEISKNDSPLYDETIAHRVGLIPLETPGTTGESSSGELSLNVKRQGVVYSGDLKGKPSPSYDNIPITTLNKGQEIVFKAKVRSGQGIEHSKFSPGIMFYRSVAKITLDKSLLDKIKNTYPESKIEDAGNKIIILDNQKKEIADFCSGLAEKEGKDIDVKEENNLVITLESFGQMDAGKIFSGSISALKKDLEGIKKEIKKK